MKKHKIGDIIFWIIIFLFLINTFLAYVSYKTTSENEKPSIYLKESKEDNKTTYNVLLFKIVIEETDQLKTISLKLFFLD